MTKVVITVNGVDKGKMGGGGGARGESHKGLQMMEL